MNFFVNFALKTNIVGDSLTDYFFQSNFAGQVIVVLLLVLSVMAWGVMFCKYSDLVSIDELNKSARRKVAKYRSLIEAAGALQGASPFGKLLKDAINTLASLGNAARVPAATRTAMVENALNRSVSEQLEKYESKMVLLGTIISGAPFLGLLGTAWGVMDCFGSMSGQTSVTLQQLAPGVAGALLTTVAGLVVAIPSVFGYNYLSSKIKQMTVDIENYAGLLSDKIEIEAATGAPAAAATREPKAAPVSGRMTTSPDASKIIDFSLDDDSEEISNFDEE